MKNKKEGQDVSVFDTVPFKSSMFALNGLFFASHLVINSRYLTQLSDDGAEASSIASTYLSALLGAGVGFVLSTGLNFGPLVGQKKCQKAGNIAKTALSQAVMVGLGAAAFCLLPLAVFPLAYDKEPAKLASHFVAGYAPGVVGMLLNVVGMQLTFVNKEWYTPPLSMLGVMSVATAMSYALGFSADLGAFGIGLGGSAANLLVGGAMILSLTRQKFGAFNFFSQGIGDFKDNISTLFGDGWKISFQRMSEWINQFAIATVIAHTQNSALGSFNTAMVSQLLFGILMQSYAQALGMLVAKNRGMIQKLGMPSIENTDRLLEVHQDNVRTSFKGNVGAFAVSSLCAVIAISAQTPLASYFLSSSATHDQFTLAKRLDIANGIGMLADGMSISIAGALRGWDDLLVPPMMRLGLMSLVGIPLGYGLSQAADISVSESLIWTRNATALLSVFALGYRLYKQLKTDEGYYALRTSPDESAPIYTSRSSSPANDTQSTIEDANP